MRKIWLFPLLALCLLAVLLSGMAFAAGTAEEDPPVSGESVPEGGDEQGTGGEIVTAPVLTAELSADEKTLFITAENIVPEAVSVQFPVWSAENDQDDLVWIKAQKSDEGNIWSAKVSVSAFKHTGEIVVHGYYEDQNGMHFFAEAHPSVTKPSGVVSVENLDAENGTFTVRVSSLNVPAGVKLMQVPVWGAADDQNDIVWYQAIPDGDDYIIDVSAKNHGYENGRYCIHCYVTDENGKTFFLGSTSAEISIPTGLEASVDENEKMITVRAVGINPSATVVQFPVWSAAKEQDDLIWVRAIKESPGVWKASFPVSDFKSTGLFYIHCYETVKGAQKYFGNAKVTVTEPKAEYSIEDINPKKGTFTVRISGISLPSGVKKVEVPIWGAVNGQNDIVWYNAVQQGNDYIVKASAGKHQYETGKYLVHCYVTDGNNIKSFAGSTSVDVTLESGVSVTVSEDETNAVIEFVGPQAASVLRAAVWSTKKDQDDLVWYNMKQSGGGASVTVPISNHKTAGKYLVHIYSGNTCVEKTFFTIQAPTADSLSVSDTDPSKGTFKITVTGAKSVSGVSKVSVAVWPNGDQSKIRWYTAKKSGSKYIVNADVANHQWAFGEYTIHAYVYGNNGVSNLCATGSNSIEAVNYVYAEKTGKYSRRIWLIGADPDVAAVQFPTWSETGSQDDIKWYGGVKTDQGWYADVGANAHRHGGKFITHCYVKKNGEDKSAFAGSTSFTMERPSSSNNQQMFDMAQSFTSPTPYLILVNRALHWVAIYQGSQYNWTEIKYWPCVVGKPTTPTPAGTFQIKGRFYWFGEDHKCWWPTQIEGYYYFHTVIYYWDDAPLRVLDGTMDAAASMGCVRLEEPNAKWIWDNIPRGTTVHIF